MVSSSILTEIYDSALQLGALTDLGKRRHITLVMGAPRSFAAGPQTITARGDSPPETVLPVLSTVNTPRLQFGRETVLPAIHSLNPHLYDCHHALLAMFDIWPLRVGVPI